MIAQAARRADDNMNTAFQRPPFGARVHAADTRGRYGTGFIIKPGQFFLHLKGKFAGRGNGQGNGSACLAETVLAVKQRRGKCEAKGNGLAGPGLR